MSKSRNGRHSPIRPKSAVASSVLRHYRRASRTPTTQQDSQLLMCLAADYNALMEAGDLVHALGAGLEIVGLGLRIAATPSVTDSDRAYKASLFSRDFPTMMRNVSHGHVTALADITVAAEQALSANPTLSSD